MNAQLRPFLLVAGDQLVRYHSGALPERKVGTDRVERLYFPKIHNHKH